MVTDMQVGTLGYAADAALGGCLAACLITDAERYTGVAETLAPPSVVDLVNSYLEALFAPVLRNGGIVSDVKGDGLLAVWNEDCAGEQFRARACLACLEILAAVERFNDRQPAARLPTRLGVDLGRVAIARVGAHARYEYRAVGDPVNTASRLGDLNKLLGTRILVSEPLTQGVRGFLFRDLGSFHLRGKHIRTRVTELVGRAERCTLRQHEICSRFGAALAAFEDGDLRAAHARWRGLHARFPEDGPTRYYLDRIEREGGWLERLWRM
jgi:adenylate cyclase